MTESSPNVDKLTSAPSLMPLVRLAAARGSDSACSRANAAWRPRVVPTDRRAEDDGQTSDSWFQALKETFRHRTGLRVGTTISNPTLNTRAEARARELIALQLVVADIQEELKRALEREKRAHHLAFHDELTALPNRRFFRERLDLAVSNPGGSSPPLAVFYLDLDGFKALNDNYGHDTGDALLHLVATRLSHAVRAEDLVSRLGGDEYACLIAGVSSRERLQQIASTLFKAVSAPFTIGALTLTVRPSIGVAVYPSDGSTTDELLKAADKAMYSAKRSRSVYSFAERSDAAAH